MAARSIINPPSTVARPPTLWPPPRTAISRACSRAKRTARAISAEPEHWAITAGRMWTSPLCTRLASSHDGWAGSNNRPLKSLARSATAEERSVMAVLLSTKGSISTPAIAASLAGALALRRRSTATRARVVARCAGRGCALSPHVDPHRGSHTHAGRACTGIRRRRRCRSRGAGASRRCGTKSGRRDEPRLLARGEILAHRLDGAGARSLARRFPENDSGPEDELRRDGCTGSRRPHRLAGEKLTRKQRKGTRRPRTLR